MFVFQIHISFLFIICGLFAGVVNSCRPFSV